MQSHVNCHSYLPSLSHSSLFSWSDYSLHFQLLLQSKERGSKRGDNGGEADFQIEFEMWNDCKWSEQELGGWKNARDAAVCISGGAHLELLQMPWRRWGGLQGAPLAGSIRSRGGGERGSVQENGKKREPGVAFLLPSSCSLQSFLFYQRSKRYFIIHPQPPVSSVYLSQFQNIPNYQHRKVKVLIISQYKVWELSKNLQKAPIKMKSVWDLLKKCSVGTQWVRG